MVAPEVMWKERSSVDTYNLLGWGKSRGIHEKVVRVLERRGFKTVGEVERFLFGELADATSPLKFGDEMHKAVNRIKLALKNSEKVMVFFDYDVDGTTGGAIMVSTLQELQKHFPCEIIYTSSNRFTEGYGLNDKNVDRVIGSKPNLVITVDCGIASAAQVTKLKEHNIDTIITDHHELQSVLPTDAVAIIHPQYSKDYPTADISGAAVAYQLCRGIWEVNGKEAPPAIKNLQLDLVGLGAVCDIMDLKATDNRIYIKESLASIGRGDRMSLRLMGSEKFANWKKVTPYTFGFQIGPRINAAGRMDDAECVVDMLLSRDSNEIELILEDIEERNAERKKQQEYIVEEGLKQLLSPKYEYLNVIVGDDFHEGIVGIAASKISEKRYRPTFVLTKAKEKGFIKGSARSIQDVNLFGLMEKFQEHLSSWGGHHAAAGLTLREEELDVFFEKLERELSTYTSDTWIKKNKWDEVIEAKDVNDNLFESLKLLEPTGQGFPQVVWKLHGVIKEKAPVSKNPNKQDPNRAKGTVLIDGQKEFPYLTWDKGQELEVGKRCVLYGAFGYNDFSKRYEFTIKGIE